MIADEQYACYACPVPAAAPELLLHAGRIPVLFRRRSGKTEMGPEELRARDHLLRRGPDAVPVFPGRGQQNRPDPADSSSGSILPAADI